MFGMGFMEIFLVLIVAIIALGPEKLPNAAVDIVKFFKKFKSSIDDAKSTLDQELNISQMKKEAEEFKSSVSNIKNITHLEMEEITSVEVSETKNEVVNKTKKEKIPKKQHTSSNKNKVV
ncbi:MAG: sec-independent protein translocase protein TatB [Arcobacteraceae bacterium]|jgi:sec-independent protein translocase protein TatB